MCVDQNNSFANIDGFKNIFNSCRKSIDYKSPNLDIIRFDFKQ